MRVAPGWVVMAAAVVVTGCATTGVSSHHAINIDFANYQPLDLGQADAMPLPGFGRAEPPASQPQPPRPDPKSGAYSYRAFCASCHGEGGRGDGIVADLLRKPPSDLTTISARRQAAFPTEEIIAIVDGRQTVRAHGRPEMPVWGDALLALENRDPKAVRRRIEALVGYVESIQKP